MLPFLRNCCHSSFSGGLPFMYKLSLTMLSFLKSTKPGAKVQGNIGKKSGKSSYRLFKITKCTCTEKNYRVQTSTDHIPVQIQTQPCKHVHLKNKLTGINLSMSTLALQLMLQATVRSLFNSFSAQQWRENEMLSFLTNFCLELYIFTQNIL